LTHTINGGVTMRSVSRIQILAGTILFAGCDTAVASLPVRHDVRFRTDTSTAAYFGVFRTWGDSVWLPMFAATLQGMGEPPLRSATLMHSERVLRFTWQRTFHPDVAVRVTESAAGCSVVTTVRTQLLFLVTQDSISHAFTTKPAPQSTLRRDSTALAATICIDLFARLEAIGVSTDRPHSPGGGADGAHWVFERVDARGHGCLETWSPDSSRSPAIWNAGMALLNAGRALPRDASEFY
jgi:hypothetical protein